MKNINFISAIEDGNGVKASYLVFEYLSPLIDDSEFNRIDNILEQICVANCQISTLLSVLAITKCAKDNLQKRKSFRDSVANVLIKHDYIKLIDNL